MTTAHLLMIEDDATLGASLQQRLELHSAIEKLARALRQAP